MNKKIGDAKAKHDGIRIRSEGNPKNLTELGGILSGMETKPTKEVMKEIKEGWE